MWNMVTQHTMAELGITRHAGRASCSWWRAGKCVLTAAELAREYGIDASAVTRLIDRPGKARAAFAGAQRGGPARRAARADAGRLRASRQKIPADFHAACWIGCSGGFTPEEVGFLKEHAAASA